MSSHIRRRPEPAAYELPYWEGARRGELVLQRCKGSGMFMFPPALAAPPWCAGQELEWVSLGSDIVGTLYSFTVVHRAFNQELAREVPYVVGLGDVSRAPGAHVLANVLGISPQDLRIGMPLRLAWEAYGDVILPQWHAA